MTIAPFPSVVQLNGGAATPDALAPLAFAGHAHFTAMQVRDGRVRGLDLHLARLRDASNALFGQALPDDRIRALLRAALERAPSALSLTATVHATTGEFVAPRDDETLDVLVRTAAPSSGPAGPLDLALFEYERVLPEIKHVGEVAKTHFLRRAIAQGFDDAAFVDRHRASAKDRSGIWRSGPATRLCGRWRTCSAASRCASCAGNWHAWASHSAIVN